MKIANYTKRCAHSNCASSMNILHMNWQKQDLIVLRTRVNGNVKASSIKYTIIDELNTLGHAKYPEPGHSSPLLG